MWRFLLTAGLATIPLQGFAALQAPLFKRLPTGAIKPSGWAHDQAQIQADGLAGHIRDFGSYVKGSIWVEGGSIEYSEMHESAPYWFNAQVALAFQLQDQRLIGQVRSFLDWTLDHQQSDGWIGPEVFVPNATIPRLVWPRFLVLHGLIQYAEADPTQAPRIIDAMHKFVALAHDIWKAGKQGTPDMGFQFDYQFVRWEEFIYILEWMHDNAPQGKEAMLLETMQLVRNQGFSWKTQFYTNATFPKTPVTSFNQHTHGVNNAQALKSEALAWRFTGDASDRTSTFDRIDMMYRYHGRASGTFSADEHLAGLDPSRGTELCAVVEQIFSLATVYQIFGDNSIADRVEKLAYNALPAAIMPDWWSHQYDQQVNQIWSQSMNPPPWGNNGPNSNVFGFEPNYPCCTVNHPQGYPRFWAHQFFTNQAGNGLFHALLGPSTFSGTLGSSNPVKVSVDTLYPFGSTLSYSITAARAFSFNIRVPGWARSPLSTIAVGRGNASPLAPNASGFHVVQIPAGTTTLRVSLNMPLQVETRTNGAVAITRGALNYAVEISHNSTAAPGTRSAQALGDVKRLYPNAPAEFLTATDPHTKEFTLLPTTEWRLAIDPATIAVTDNSGKTTSLPSQAWAPGNQPVTMSARACQINWGLKLGTAAAPPSNPSCVGAPFTVKLVPFAAAKLRLGEVPTVKIA
ncbi:hypothetical protein BDZ94DRAFT_1199867 [Collybia nuda]|uniref:Uncharacterized protein n=1 Tax=Collybia nuda TaxID=64659 RepID=A0A9P6CFR3_9AGAR|nr:hypothetical protein BDZ94DRAFT_1199867 [Collybia nuda]